MLSSVLMGKPGNRFRRDKVDSVLRAVLNHLVETIALLCMHTGNTIICINTRDLPLRVDSIFLGVVQLLDFKTALLFCFLSANTAVGSYPQLAHGIFRRHPFPH